MPMIYAGQPPGPGDLVTIPRRLYWLLPLFLLASISTRADSAQVYVNGSYAFADHGYGISPYGGTLNGVSASFYCIDFNHDIVGQTGWSATVTYLPTSPSVALPGTLLGSSTLYLDMAWMITKMMGATNQTIRAEYQWAIWSLSVGSNPSAPYDPYNMNGTLIGNAQTAVNGGWSASGWEILTPISGTGYPGQPGYYGQEFMVVATPEPPPILLLFVGLAGLGLFALRK